MHHSYPELDTSARMSNIYLDVNGWVRQRHGEPGEINDKADKFLFWVPREYRDQLILPYRRTIIGGNPIEVNMSKFVYGDDWTGCYTPEKDS